MNEIHFDPKLNISELLTLLSLKNLPQTGYQIEHNVINMTHGQYHFGQATVYRTLTRLQKAGYVTLLNGGLVTGRNIYDLTQDGERRLRNEILLLRQLTSTYDHR